MRRDFLNRDGFSLLEASIALAIGMAFLTSVLIAWFFSTKIWKEENIRSQLRYGIERSMEKIKADTRLSDQNSMLFYPATSASSSYTAISLATPKADPSATGFLTLSSGAIDWSQGETIVYSVYNNSVTGKQEFRRTIFNSFNTSSTARQTQLNNVATTGTDTGGVTTALFSADSTVFQATAADSTFDGYASSAQRSANTNFGGYRLASGTHQIKFLVTGQNASSSGKYIGIDDIALDPSGGSQETEDLTNSTFGMTPTYPDMTGYASGTWGGNTQTEYPATTTNDYIQFQVNYDQWLESNFAHMTHLDTAVSGTNPVITNASREIQGASPGWSGEGQTGSPDPAAYTVTGGGQSVRAIIKGASVTKNADMIRFEFLDGGSGTTINSAYFGPKSGIAGLSSSTQLCFETSDVAEGAAEPVGSVGCGAGTTTGPISIAAGNHRWTTWFEPSSSITAATGPDYMISYYSPSGTPMSWDESGGTDNAYMVDGDHAAGTVDWSTAGLTGYATSTTSIGIEEMSTWRKTGTASSQIYDTKISAPVYGNISWTSALPAGASATLKVRSSVNADMTSASAWSSFTVSPSSLAAVPNRRYIQFQAILTAASPYTTLPTVDTVKIDWPGQTALVQISGHFTKKSNYGIFQVLIDENSLVKTLGVSLAAAADYRGHSFTNSLSVNIKPKNTGK